MNAMGDVSDGVSKEVVRIAATSDVHCRRGSKGLLRPVFAEMAERADILVLCGDLTHFGLIEEVDVFLHEAAPVLGTIPVLSVLGNHDFESGRQDEIWNKLRDAGISMFDGDVREILGIGFTGVKGFGGGFAPTALHPWGEAVIKNFVKEAVDESIKLENGLGKLEPGPRIVLLHYAPIRDTIAGEPSELYPFLGSSLLEEPLNRHAVTAAFHGHAHKGHWQGRTSANVPVYNVSVPVLKGHFPERPPYIMIEVPVK
jgi:Icc-related predicted phosphoesterase